METNKPPQTPPLESSMNSTSSSEFESLQNSASQPRTPSYDEQITPAESSLGSQSEILTGSELETLPVTVRDSEILTKRGPSTPLGTPPQSPSPLGFSPMIAEAIDNYEMSPNAFMRILKQEQTDRVICVSGDNFFEGFDGTYVHSLIKVPRVKPLGLDFMNDVTCGLNPAVYADIGKTLGLLSRPKSNPEELLALLSNQICWQKEQLGSHRRDLQAAYKQQFNYLSQAQRDSILSRLGTRQLAALKQELKTINLITTKDMMMTSAERKKLVSLLSDLQTDIYSFANDRIVNADNDLRQVVDHRPIVFHEPVPGKKDLVEARKIVDRHILAFELSVARHAGEIDLTNLPDRSDIPPCDKTTQTDKGADMATQTDEAADMTTQADEATDIDWDKVIDQQDRNVSDLDESSDNKIASNNEQENESLLNLDKKRYAPDQKLNYDEIQIAPDQPGRPNLNAIPEGDEGPLFRVSSIEKQLLAEQKKAEQKTLKNAEYMPSAFLSKESFQSRLSGQEPHLKYDLFPDSFVKELRKSKFVLVHPDGTSEFLADQRLSNPSVNWDSASETEKEMAARFEMEAIDKLIIFCEVKKPADEPVSKLEVLHNRKDSYVPTDSDPATYTNCVNAVQAVDDVGMLTAINISKVANKDGIDFGNAFRENMHRSRALQLPEYGTVRGVSPQTPSYMVTQASGEPRNTDFPKQSEEDNEQSADVKRQSDNCYVIKADGNGGYTVTLHSETQLVGLQQTTYRRNNKGISESKVDLVNPINSSFSHWNTTTSASIDRDLNVTLNNFKYDYKAASYLSPVDGLDNRPLLSHQETVQNWCSKLGVPLIPHPYAHIGQEQYLEAGKTAQQDFAGLKEDGNYDSAIEIDLHMANLNAVDDATLRATYNFLKEKILFLARPGIKNENQQKVCAQYEAILEMIRAKQVELAHLASVDSAQTEHLHDDNNSRVTVCSELSQLGALLASSLEELVADYRSAASDLIMDEDLVVAANQFNTSKVEFARMQSCAVYLTIDQIISRYETTVGMENPRNYSAATPGLQAQSQPPETREFYTPERSGEMIRSDLNNLQKIMQSRHLAHSKRVANALEGNSASGIFGVGISKKEFTALAKEVAKGKTKIEDLPVSHPNLSEAQLCKLQIESMKRSNPALMNEVADFDQLYKDNYLAVLKEQNWAPIENTYFDHIIAETGNKVVNTGPMERKSVITPAPNFREEKFAATYNGKGVPCSERTQAKHVNNLALTQQFDHEGKILYSGLRHGILDAYDLRPKVLAAASETVKNALINDINNFTGKSTVSRENFNSKAGIAELRRLAGASMAQELVKAAVVTNPRMLEKIGAGQPVHLTLDSVSLVTPDLIRGWRNSGKSERILLTNQIAALDSLKDEEGNPKEIKFTVMINDHEIEATVKTEVNKYNISVSKYALAEGFRSLLKPFMNWRRSDRISKPSLERLVGSFNRNSPEEGGEAAQVIRYLLKEPNDSDLSAERQADIEAHLKNLPFQTREEYAEAIRQEASEIRDIFRRKSHHRAGNDPYKLAVRIPMLSHLLGHTPAINCKNGKDRTGMNDAMLKHHSSNVAANHHPQPDSVPDPVRITNFSLNSGNLRMQQYNTGLQGYKLLGVPALFRSLQGSLAKALFLGHSDKIKE